MQTRRLILFIFLLLGSFFTGRVEAAFDVPCPSCGSYYPYCWTPYCSSRCTYGCTSTSCSGGTCKSAPPSYDCSDRGLCGGTVSSWSDCYSKSCKSSKCPCGCHYSTCSGGACKPCPPACTRGDSYCEGSTLYFCDDGWNTSTCTYGCSNGACNSPPPPPECTNGDNKCENSVAYLCVNESWQSQQTCGFGCDGDYCRQTAYCETKDCSRCPTTGEYGYQCWYTSDKNSDECIPSSCEMQYSVDANYCNNYCEVDACKVVSETCGGTLSCPSGQESHIDNCGGMSCGALCDPDGSGGCLTEYPVAPELVSPEDGGVGGETVELVWEVSADYGNGCPSSNSQVIYLEAGDSSPDEVLDMVAASTTLYTAEDLSPGETYYWRVLARNGALSMTSDVYSFDTEATITGYFFDSGGLSVCPADLSDPAYDSLKLSGGSLDITGTNDYLGVITDGDGLYTAYVDTPGSYVLENFNPGGGYVSTPDLVCDGTSVEFVTGGAGTAVRSFGFLRDYGGWWQAEGGDVYAGGGVESVVPRTCLVSGGCQPYLIRSDVSGESGLLAYLTGGMELGHNDEADVSADGWLANTGYEGQDTTYAYYTSKMALLEKTSWVGSGKPEFNPEIGNDYEIYVFEGNATIDFDIEADEKMIFMVDGDVGVSDDVEVAVGGHLAVIASGTVTFESNVVQAEGWWVGDTLVVASTGDESTDAVFRGEGSFVGWSQVDLGRDRGRGNDTQPTEEFIFRADLMINAPEALKFSRYVWQEKAP